MLVLPDDAVHEADAVVSVGHVLNDPPDEASIERALSAMAGALRVGGLLVFDICDLTFPAARREAPPYARVEDDWAIFTTYDVPSPDRFVRPITTFVRQDDGSWHRDDERHQNVLVDTSTLPPLLAAAGTRAEVAASFGDESRPEGIVAVVGRR